MKKKSLIITIIILIIISLIPIRLKLKDGGTVKYKAIIYEVSKVHSLTTVEEMLEGKRYNEGIIVKILGLEIYNNVK